MAVPLQHLSHLAQKMQSGVSHARRNSTVLGKYRCYATSVSRDSEVSVMEEILPYHSQSLAIYTHQYWCVSSSFLSSIIIYKD